MSGPHQAPQPETQYCSSQIHMKIEVKIYDERIFIFSMAKSILKFYDTLDSPHPPTLQRPVISPHWLTRLSTASDLKFYKDIQNSL